MEKPKGRFDLVLCDAPCSGSGAWRRQPDAKWRLQPDMLNALTLLQSEILDTAKAHVAPDGVLAFATCSLLHQENDAVAAQFLTDNPDWTRSDRHAFSPLDGGDGFFLATFQRVTGV